MFPPSTAAGIVLVTPIYDALLAMGGTIDGEYVRFGEWPLQILRDANSLIAEAITQAEEVDYDGIPTRVFRPEHLCAIALHAGRSKDVLRTTMFFEQQAVDLEILEAVLNRYDLMARAKGLAPQYFGGGR